MMPVRAIMVGPLSSTAPAIASKPNAREPDQQHCHN
jgi:hypothetical protein